jgi:hypothetical protein
MRTARILAALLLASLAACASVTGPTESRCTTGTADMVGADGTVYPDQVQWEYCPPAPPVTVLP